MIRWTILVVCVALAGCTTTQVQTASDISKPTPNSGVLTLQPDVQLAELTASGLQETRADWSTAATNNLAAATKQALDAKGLKYTTLDPSTVTEGRNAQLLRLNATVNTSILIYNLNLVRLPTHKSDFNWTLGEGAKSLGQTYGADYALCTIARGDYSSSGRKVMFIAMAAAGISIPLGGQQVQASLVDLKTGRVIWYNLARASPDSDMRDADGAKRLMAEVLKSAPF
jgi:hypothetical protein